MPTTVERVENYLQTDLPLQVALDRGFLNVRKTARWLITTQDWDCTEEAVVSALRRYEPDLHIDVDSILHIIGGADLRFNTGLSIVSIPAAAEFREKISNIVNALDPEDTFTVCPERKRTNLIVDSDEVEVVLQNLPNGGCCKVESNLGLVEAHLNEEGRVAGSALSVMVNVLSHRGITVRSIFGVLPTASILVPEDETPDAFDILMDLIGRV